MIILFSGVSNWQHIFAIENQHNSQTCAIPQICQSQNSLNSPNTPPQVTRHTDSTHEDDAS